MFIALGNDLSSRGLGLFGLGFSFVFNGSSSAGVDGGRRGGRRRRMLFTGGDDGTAQRSAGRRSRHVALSGCRLAFGAAYQRYDCNDGDKKDNDNDGCSIHMVFLK